MKLRSVTPMKIAKAGYIAVSVLFITAGVFFIFKTEPSVAAISRFIGISMCIFGIIKLIGYFSKDLFRLAFQYDLELGIVLLILGLILIIHPTDFVISVFAITGIAIVLDSLFKIRIAFDAKNFGIDSWLSILIIAVISDVVGIFLIFCPWESIRILAVILGISLCIQGILNLCMVTGTVKIIDYQYPDVVDVPFTEIEDKR